LGYMKQINKMKKKLELDKTDMKKLETSHDKTNRDKPRQTKTPPFMLYL
jgi:hypothetical protein